MRSYISEQYRSERMDVPEKLKRSKEAAEGIPVIARIPIASAMTAACDAGKIEYYAGDFMVGLEKVLPEI